MSLYYVFGYVFNFDHDLMYVARQLGVLQAYKHACTLLAVLITIPLGLSMPSVEAPYI